MASVQGKSGEKTGSIEWVKITSIKKKNNNKGLWLMLQHIRENYWTVLSNSLLQLKRRARRHWQLFDYVFLNAVMFFFKFQLTLFFFNHSCAFFFHHGCVCLTSRATSSSFHNSSTICWLSSPAVNISLLCCHGKAKGNSEAFTSGSIFTNTEADLHFKTNKKSAGVEWSSNLPLKALARVEKATTTSSQKHNSNHSFVCSHCMTKII